VAEFLRTLDLFVLPSLTEGIPLALLEAMSARLPIVATAVGGVPEVVAAGESALLVPPNDPAALSGAMLELRRDPERGAALARSAERRVRQRHGLGAMARAYRWLYLSGGRTRLWKRAAKTLTRGLPRTWMAWRGTGRRREIALTFDDGPHPVFTPQVLDLLRAHGARATFFLVGERVAAEPALAARIQQEGHEVASHSYSHPDFGRLSLRDGVAEVRRGQDVIRSAVGQAPRLFRPPEGKLCRASMLGAWRLGLSIIMWSVDLKDYRAQQAEEITDRLVVESLRDGDIVLYHGSSAASVAALPRVLEAGALGGRALVTVSRLLE
jgi:peptidoglycan/xylan/chitin deacetylase (PgdA/CDA1 family)